MMVGNPWEKFIGPRAFHSGQPQSSMAAAGRPAAGDGFLLVNFSIDSFASSDHDHSLAFFRMTFPSFFAFQGS